MCEWCMKPFGTTSSTPRRASSAAHQWVSSAMSSWFAINDSASSLCSGYTPFYADRCQHPRRPLTPPAGQDPPTRPSPPGPAMK